MCGHFGLEPHHAIQGHYRAPGLQTMMMVLNHGVMTYSWVERQTIVLAVWEMACIFVAGLGSPLHHWPIDFIVRTFVVQVSCKCEWQPRGFSALPPSPFSSCVLRHYPGHPAAQTLAS